MAWPTSATATPMRIAASGVVGTTLPAATGRSRARISDRRSALLLLFCSITIGCTERLRPKDGVALIDVRLDGIEIAAADDLGKPICRIEATDYIEAFAVDWKRKSLFVVVRKMLQATFAMARIDLQSGDIEPIAGGLNYESGLSAWDGSVSYVSRKIDGSCESVIDGAPAGPFACRATTALTSAELILSSEKSLEVRERTAPFDLIESFPSRMIRISLSPDETTLASFDPSRHSVEITPVRNLHKPEVVWNGLAERRLDARWNWNGSITITKGFRPWLASCSEQCAELIHLDPALGAAQKGTVVKRETIGTGFLVDFVPTCPTESLP